MKVGRSRKITLAAVAAVAALILYWRSSSQHPPPGSFPLTKQLPESAARTESTPVVPRVSPTRPAPTALRGAEASRQEKPRPPAFDLATIPRSGTAKKGGEEERFTTNEWFTEDDLQHPELYFERAEEIEELNRPEERRDTLEFFLAYRERLRHELDLPENRDERARILATIERYDEAIARLRKLIEAEGAE